MALYATGAVIAWLFALGPIGHVFGHRFWYKAPFSWFMQWPGFDSVRVPARFMCVEILCLAVIAAFAFARLWPASKRGSALPHWRSPPRLRSMAGRACRSCQLPHPCRCR